MGHNLRMKPRGHDRRPIVGRKRTLVSLLSGAAWAVWGFAVLWLVVEIVSEIAGVSCPPYADDSSSIGRQRWSWLPPGMSCTYRDFENHVVVRVPPSPALVLLLGVLVAMPIAVKAAVALRRPAAPTD